MFHNPAASFDLGSFLAASDYDEEYVMHVASSVHADRPTVEFGKARFHAAYDAWLDSQIGEAEQSA